jgi:penicillin-binding protein 2
MAQETVEIELIKIRMISMGMLLMLAGLLGYLWKIQVVQGAERDNQINRQSIRRVRLPERRGKIVDRNNEILADNRPSFNIAIYIEEVRQPGSTTRTVNKVMSVIEELSFRMGVPCGVVRDDVKEHWKRQLSLPFVVWEDVGPELMARFAECGAGIPGVDIHTEAVRVYPFEDSACHILGRVSPMSRRTNDTERFHFYLPSMEGKTGIEKMFDTELSGQSGGQLLRVDAFGYRHEEVGSIREPENGKDVQLTIDVRLQRLAESALGSARGSVVIMDPNNGDVLAMASFPRYNLNNFIPKISQAEYDVYRLDTRKPFINRAIQQYYPPGSIYKPLVALAALESGKINSGQQYQCHGHIMVGNRKKHCALHSGHGLLNFNQGMERSCNVYYFKLAKDIGYEYIRAMAHDLGIGQKTGIQLEHEKPGLLPDNRWKVQTFREGWTIGDTYNAAIGQGFVDVTPLQMANMTATIANGGTRYRPRIVKGLRDPATQEITPIKSVVEKELWWSKASQQAVRRGMYDVVQGRKGTARSARVEGVPYAAKTGTAQFGPPGRYHGWMIAFAPYVNPKYAIALVVEDTPYSSGVVAAPRMKKIIEEIFHVGEEVP